MKAINETIKIWKPNWIKFNRDRKEKSSGEGNEVIWGISICTSLICIFLLFLWGWKFSNDPKNISNNFYGMILITIISLQLGIIQTSFGEKNYEYMNSYFTLWSFGHLIIPITIVLGIFLFSQDFIISVVFGIIAVIGFEIAEYLGRILNIQTQFTHESFKNTIVDIILDWIGVLIGLWFII